MKLVVDLGLDWDVSLQLGLTSVVLAALGSYDCYIKKKKKLYFGTVKVIPVFIQIFLDAAFNSIISVGEANMYTASMIDR